jgi:hypothetical protein
MVEAFEIQIDVFAKKQSEYLDKVRTMMQQRDLATSTVSSLTNTVNTQKARAMTAEKERDMLRRVVVQWQETNFQHMSVNPRIVKMLEVTKDILKEIKSPT